MGTDYEQLARQFQQLHDLAKLLIALSTPSRYSSETKNDLEIANNKLNSVKSVLDIEYSPVTFLISFTTIAIGRSYEVAKENNPDFATIIEVIDKSNIGVQPGFSKAAESSLTSISGAEKEKEAVFRHLRNSFAHGNYKFEVNEDKQINIKMEDFKPNGNKSFEASCEFFKIGNLAEKILIGTYGILTSKI